MLARIEDGPGLGRVLQRMSKRDALVVMCIDRLARLRSHLFEVIERLEAKGAFSRSIQDPIDALAPLCWRAGTDRTP